jgi:serine/threonine protein kinase
LAYTIESLIGSGGMGEVYKAHDVRLNRTVAIKRMIAEDKSRFESEARALPRSTIHTSARSTTSVPITSSSNISRENRCAVPSPLTRRFVWRARLPTDCTRRTNAAFFTAI